MGLGSRRTCDDINEEEGGWIMRSMETAYTKSGLVKRGIDKSAKRHLFASFSQQL